MDHDLLDPPRTTDPKRLLIVDDDHDFAESIVELLEPHGYEMARAHNAKDARDIIETFCPDVAILDIRLGSDSGISLINELKGIKPNVLCVLVTAYAEVDSAVGAIQEGAYDYLRKPLNAMVLFATLDRCFERVRYEREKAQTLAALAQSEARYRELVETSQDVIFRSDSQGVITFINPICEEIFGYRPDEMIGHSFGDFQTGEYAERDRPSLRQIAQGLSLHGHETMFMAKAGYPVHIIASARPILNDENAIVGIQGTLHEITQRKEAEEKLRQSLAEKELLLKEVYHRVKNNLQLISSLLSLQANHSQNADAQRIFNECQNRVRTMAMVHERLYQSNNLSYIELGEFARSLANDLHRSLQAAPNHIKLNVEAEPAYLGVDKAVPCGLILNEVISNALKHAFPENRSGTIIIEVKDQNGRVSIAVIDDGVGLPDDFDRQNTKSLGLKLINALARQLKAEMSIENSQGTRFNLTFPSGH